MIEIRVVEFAEKLGVHRNTVRNWIKNGTLRASSTVAKKYFIQLEDLRRFCRLQSIPENLFAQLVPKNFKSLAVKEETMNMNPTSTPQVRPIGARDSLLRADPQWADVCLTCGSCASACPISGVDGMDPRKIVRLVVLGRIQEVVASNWPWKCTMCGKCEEACPMNVELVKLFRRIRGRTRIHGEHRCRRRACRPRDRRAVDRRSFHPRS